MTDLILNFAEPILRGASNFLGGPTTLSDLGRAVTILPFFIIVGYLDLRDREIPRKYWYPVIGLAVVFLVWDVIHSVPEILLPRIALNITFATLFGMFFYGFHKLPGIPEEWQIFWMGDLKAILLLGIAIPTYPLLGAFPLFKAPVHVLRLFFIAILQWTAIVGLVYIVILTIVMLTRNDHFEFPESLLGYTVSPNSLMENRNYRVMHRDGGITFDGLSDSMVSEYMEWRNDPDTGVTPIDEFSDLKKVNLKQFVHDTRWGPEDPDEVDEEDYRADEEYMLEISNSDEVWILPELPFVTFIAIATFLAFIIGDPLYLLLHILS